MIFIRSDTGLELCSQPPTCPPSGTHRYFFKIYALDTMLELDSKATKSDVEAKIKGHVLAKGQIVCKYKRS